MLKEIKIDINKKYEPKFLFNYKIPGFYNFFKEISDYLDKNISNEFLKNEKKIIDINDIDYDENTNKITIIKDFHENENDLLNRALREIESNKLYKDLINKIKPSLILNDYITFYLEKSFCFYSESFYNIISLLLDIRFSNEKNIIKQSRENSIDEVIIKMMWIEANNKYIEGLLRAFELGKDIYKDKDGIKYYHKIYDLIYDAKNPIKYIINSDRTEDMKVVNECFYLFLAGLCLSVTVNNLDNMELQISDYCGILKKIYKIVKNIDNNLKTYLNELYIIDELIKIMDYNPTTKKIIIKDIRDYLIKSARIIQQNLPEKDTLLIENFKKLNELLNIIKKEETKGKYYATLKYIYKKEILKFDDKVVCAAILKEIIKEKEIIKISNDIIQILLVIEDFESIVGYLLKKNDNIIKVLNSKLSDNSRDYYLALSETIIYYFERISLIYLKDFYDIEKFVNEQKGKEKGKEKGNLKIFKDCNKFLDKLHNNKIEGNLYITMLFCIAYIKTFCNIFIKLHNKRHFNPTNVINIINESDKINMVKLYIYKIIYNKYNKQINIFINKEIINKYKLNEYKGFNEFFKAEEIEKLEHFFSDDNNSDVYKKLCEFEEKQFEEKITKNDISAKKKDFDKFYMAAYKLILSKLKKKDFENDKSFINFYPNVCKPLYASDNDDDNESNKLIRLMKFFFDKETYIQFKKEYSINSEDIDALLYGYRYCLNQVKGKDEDYIYSYLYNINNLSYFDQKCYPGDDNNEEEPYYDLYYKIENHFKVKPDEGCYVCLCDKGYYQSTPGGFPGILEINLRCPNCNNEIGAKVLSIEEKDENNNTIIIETYETVTSNKNYFRIFKDEEQIKNLTRSREFNKKMENNQYITLKEFKEKYITPLDNKKIGLNKINIINLKKENKIVRNLSPISFRLLNYILYCHLFFAKLFTESERFDNYKPEGISWITLIKECFKRLKIELEKNDIKNIEIFMNCVFNDLSDKLRYHDCINEYKDLIKFEDELEELIKEKCEISKKEINNYKELKIESTKDEKSSIALVMEKYDKSKYKNLEFPFYEFFYYTDYLNEEYISNIPKNRDENESYPLLFKYLKNKKQKKLKEENNDKDNYSLDNLYLFNKVLKLFNDKYSNQISREESERQIIKTCEIYKDVKNAELIDDFIKFYNGLKLKDAKGNNLELNVEKNCIIDFLIIDDNKKEYGKTYKDIYKIFIKKQNNEIEDLLDLKISSGEFYSNCKDRISVQQIKENEIFSLTKKFNFTKILFNSSYRKYIDTKNHENYNEFEIRFDQIESEMTNSLLVNKKLLNDDIIECNFNNEVFSYKIRDLISNFKYTIIPINMDDKEVIYNFIKDHAGNKNIYITIINNFITLIELLN